MRGGFRIAAYLAVPASLGLVLGGVLAFQAGTSNSGLVQLPLGAPVSPSPSATPSTPITMTPAANLAASVSCDIIVPANPLTARGLATPYQLTGTDGASPSASGCRMGDSGAEAFVQATILDPATGALSVYDPLVVTRGTRPAVVPAVPGIPADAVVTIDFGFNGKDLYQVGATPGTLAGANCVSGEAGSAFGPVSFCNGTGFFGAVRAAERNGRLKVPSPGTSGKITPSGGALGTGRACPVTSDFEVADPDSGDGVTADYLLNPITGQTAQDTTSNAGNMAGPALLHGRGASTLVDRFLDPVLGCVPYQVPDLANNDQLTTSWATDEIVSGAYEPGNAALMPENAPLVAGPGGGLDAAKTDAFRAELGEAPVGARGGAASGPQVYCRDLVGIQTPFLAANRALLAAGQSPLTTVGDNLLTFMATELSTSFTSLGCRDFGLADPVTITRDSAGTAVAAAFSTSAQAAQAAQTAQTARGASGT
jgi:hypothetical protein